MPTLIALRHAKSSWKTDADDHDRPLSGRGRRDARAVGRWLAARAPVPDLVLCSTALRNRQTWTEAVAGGASREKLRHEPTIYAASVGDLLRVIRSVPTSVETALVLGHAPGIPDLVEYVSRRTDSTLWKEFDRKFPTCGLAVIEVPTSWAELGRGRARLVDFVVPRG